MQANVAVNEGAAVFGTVPSKSLVDVITESVSSVQTSELIVTQTRDDDVLYGEDLEARVDDLAEYFPGSDSAYDWQNVMEQIRADPSLASDNREGILPLHAACGAGAHVEVIRMLLEIYPEAIHTESDSGHLPLMCHLLLNTESPSEDVVSLLLESYPEAAAIADENNQLPIHLACIATGVSKNIFKMLLHAYPEGAYVCDIEGFYPVDHAARNNDVATRKAALTSLIENDPEEFRGHYIEKNETRELALKDTDIDMLLNGHSAENKLAHLTHDVIDDILASFTFSEETQVLRRATSEELAAVSPDIDEKTLLVHLEQCVEHESKPLHRIVATLLEFYPTSARITNENGQLPIHLACKAVDIEFDTFNILLSAYPEGAYVCDVDGKCPIDYAVSNDDVSTRKFEIDALVQCDKQASTASPSVSYSDASSQNSEASESSSFNPPSIQNEDHDAAVEKSLLHHMEHCIEHGGSPSQAIVAKIIESYPSSTGVANKKNQLPIHLACKAVNVSETIFTLLLFTHPGGAYVCDEDGLYPIDYAAQNEDARTKKVAFAALAQNDAVIKFMKASSERAFKGTPLVISEANEVITEDEEANLNALHDMLVSNSSPPETAIMSVIESNPGTVRALDANGQLPLHRACREKSVPINVFACLLEAYPEAAYVPDKAGKYPIDYASENKDSETKRNAIAALIHNDVGRELAQKRAQAQDYGWIGACGW